MKLDQIKKIFKLVTFIGPELEYEMTSKNAGGTPNWSVALRLRVFDNVLWICDDRTVTRPNPPSYANHFNLRIFHLDLHKIGSDFRVVDSSYTSAAFKVSGSDLWA